VTAGSKPDPRRHAYREDLAAESLRGLVDAPRYVEGEPRQVTAPVLPLRRAPTPDAPLETEALFGETLKVLDEREGWAWVQLDRDSYVGYAPSAGLGGDILAPTHRISALRTFLYPGPDIKLPPLALLSLNSAVTVEQAAGSFLKLTDGSFLFAAHARSWGSHASDFVSVAETLRGTPYLWGGRTTLAMDCSALVQLSLEAAGLPAPRDTDMQAGELGEPVDLNAEVLQRGDLVYWRGHVGIMTGPDALLHANAFHMATIVEPLVKARERISGEANDILCVRRLPRLAADAE
jgi:cell wall-associated NlpC family hydrolase